jgi:hypothetical protein
MRFLARRLIFCLRMRWKRAVSPHVLDMTFSFREREMPWRGALWGKAPSFVDTPRTHAVDKLRRGESAGAECETRRHSS